MSSAGLWMLVALGVAIVATGLPVWALLIGVASLFSVIGVVAGAFDTSILAAASGRIVNLLDNDLLQALPLYVFVGVLLQRVAVGDALFASAASLFRPTGAGEPLAALAVGTLIAPMNGSVASSSALLSRLVAPRLGTMEPGGAIALVSAAATIGVVVPPSLVLLLLGDAMLRAHTEASNLPGYAMAGERIVNTRDVLQAALLPALCVLLAWGLVVWRTGRTARASQPVSPSRAQFGTAITATAVIVALLAAVFTGRLFAVEAAATAACLLVAWTVASRRLDRAQWHTVLFDTLALSGALFALLVGATTFSLVLRLFATDRWLAEMILASPLSPLATAACVLLAVALCACVLDAFEMIFVVVPIVAPLLVLELGDARQAAVLLLLVLQMSFLLPPMGYAVVMARSASRVPPVRTQALVRALAPFVGVQLAVIALVFAAPRMVHVLDEGNTALNNTTPGAIAPTDADVTRQMEEMARPAEPETEAAEPPQPAASR